MSKIHLSPSSSSINYYKTDGSSDGSSDGGSGVPHYWYCEDCRMEQGVDGDQSVYAEKTGHLFKDQPYPTFGNKFDVLDYEGQKIDSAWEVTWTGTTPADIFEVLNSWGPEGTSFSISLLLVSPYYDIPCVDTGGNFIISGRTLGGGDVNFFSFPWTIYNYRDGIGTTSVGVLIHYGSDNRWLLGGDAPAGLVQEYYPLVENTTK